MMKGVWGKKIGMTQLFSEGRVVPVTVIDCADWVVTAIKTEDRDGYVALQVGLVRPKYQTKPFSKAWLKDVREYFFHLKEVAIAQGDFSIGQRVDLAAVLAEGDEVDVAGRTKGCGFAGTRRRHDFNASPRSHGCTMGKRPGSMSFMRSQGRVIKGKKLPGHMGHVNRMAKGLRVIKLESNLEQHQSALFVKGSIPGKAGTLVFVRKCGE